MDNWDLISLTDELKQKAKPYLEIDEFSSNPGIYAIFFFGISFPFKPLSGRMEKTDIVYIGKTESSQKSRDEATHFMSCKTGSSTLRRSFGAFLLKDLKLNPIPRNDSDYAAGRFSFYKFDLKSEVKLTRWMQSNLGLSFYEYSESDLDDLETALIGHIVPPLNIDWKNPRNPYSKEIKELRKHCAEIASKTNIINHTKHSMIKKSIKRGSSMGANKYEKIWQDKLEAIIQSLKEASIKPVEIAMPGKLFEKVGKRKSYAFNLEIKYGKVVNNIGGSAVARDLRNVLFAEDDARKILKTGRYKLRMDSNFALLVSKLN